MWKTMWITLKHVNSVECVNSFPLLFFYPRKEKIDGTATIVLCQQEFKNLYTIMCK